MRFGHPFARVGLLAAALAIALEPTPPTRADEATTAPPPAPAREADAPPTAAPVNEAESTAPADAAQWVEIDRASEGFRASFPGEPGHVVDSFQTMLGSVTASRYIYELASEHFSIERHRLPRLSRMLAPASLILSRTRDSILTDRDAEEISFEEVTEAEHPMRVLRTRSRDQRSAFEQTHLILVGRDIFLVTAEVGEDEEAQAAVRRFFFSFQLLGD